MSTALTKYLQSSGGVRGMRMSFGLETMVLLLVDPAVSLLRQRRGM